MNRAIQKQLFSVLLVLFVTAAFIHAAEVLQTQDADLWDGIEVDITKMSVKNNIVTVKLKFRNTGTENHSVRLEYKSCYIMDEANQKKYFVLKDSDGVYIAGPQHDQSDGGRFWFEIKAAKSKNMWLKFPEPTDNPKTISISIPGVSPFDEVELKK